MDSTFMNQQRLMMEVEQVIQPTQSSFTARGSSSVIFGMKFDRKVLPSR